MSVANLEAVDTVEIPDEVSDLGDWAVERFLLWVAQNGKPTGFSLDLAIMFARKRSAGVGGTDSVNMRNAYSGNPFPEMPEKLRQHYIKQCREQGISFEGKVYMAGLVRPGYGGMKMDPQALVDSTGDVKRIIESRGWGCEGMVNVDAVEKDEQSAVLNDDYRVADDLIDEHVEREVVENHGGRIKKKHLADVREKVKEKLKGKH